MWDAPVPIFEDEDEEALISQFVALSARYPKREPMEICGVIFRDLRDPYPRANQAAMKWGSDLAIRVRIDDAILNGGAEPNPVDTKEQKLRKLEAIYNDMDVKPADRIKALELHAKISGEIDGEKDDEAGLGRRPIIVNYALDPRSQANAA